MVRKIQFCLPGYSETQTILEEMAKIGQANIFQGLLAYRTDRQL